MSPQPQASSRAADVLVRQLEIQGIEHIFCVPGESYLAVLDALIDKPITVTVCRQEGGAAMMAEAAGKLTGRPAACFVTRGPGATNSAAGLHIAQHDSTPMLLFVGQVARAFRGRGAFQEVDYQELFGSIAKWVVEIDDADRIPTEIAEAVRISMLGRPGPVVIALPEDMLDDATEATDHSRIEPEILLPADTDLHRLQALVTAAERPLMIIGGSRWSAESVDEVVALAEAWQLPVAVSFRRQMLFPASSAYFAGDVGFGINPALAERIRATDLLILLGSRMSEVPSQGYSLIANPKPQQTLVHIHYDETEFGRVYQPDLAILATPPAFVRAASRIGMPPSVARKNYVDAAHRDYLAWSDPSAIRSPGNLQMGEVMSWLNGRLPDDAILCNGAGNYATWIHRFYRFDAYATQLAPTSGSMGYGIPAAVAAKRLYPDRVVIAFAGDGCFLMNGQEFATAVQYDLPIIAIVVDNGMYGTIRAHQEREFPGRTSATDLRNPDFEAYARAFGGYGERVETAEEFANAFEHALSAGKPAILHCILDPEAISPTTTLSAIRQKALAQK